MKVVLFNGPPGCGKDTVSHMLVQHMEMQGVVSAIKEESLSMPLRHIAYAMTQFQGAFDGADYARFKGVTFAEFRGKTGRQLMIDVSEDFLKPLYGETVMAKMLIERNANFNGVMLVRDSGFQIEVDPLITAYGPHNVYLVNVTRPGKTFEGDSREWVNHPFSSHQMQLPNDGDLAALRSEAGRIYGRLVNQMGWVL